MYNNHATTDNESLIELADAGDLPIVYLNDHDIPWTPDELEILRSMQDFPPRSNLGRGDLVMLRHTPTRTWLDISDRIPRVWQVRFVVSAYQFHIHSNLQSQPHLGLDQITDMVSQGLHVHHYERPMVYCHAFPHGHYPNTAQWFPEHTLRQLVLRAPNEQWHSILDEFKTPFYGYDPEYIRGRFVFDMAPDLYGEALTKNRPLSAEENTFHSACLLGLEETMMRPVDPRNPKTARRIDPEDPVFANAMSTAAPYGEVVKKAAW